MNASWYDVLDLERSATIDEIRAAWRSATKGLDPTDRKFRVFNQAAEVLLDPDRRAAYDAELAAENPADEEVVSTSSTTEEVPAWALIGLALLTTLVSAGAVAVWYLQPSDVAIADAAAEAEAAAQRATTAIFSYDYQRLDADHDAAAGFMTADYRERYDPLFEVVKQNAPEQKAVTNAGFIASGVVRAGEGRDADDRVQVFVVFDQLTTNKARRTPSRTPAFATLTMEREGDSWLVDDVQGPPVMK